MVLKYAYAFKVFQYNWYMTQDIRLSKQSKLGRRFQKNITTDIKNCSMTWGSHGNVDKDSLVVMSMQMSE